MLKNCKSSLTYLTFVIVKGNSSSVGECVVTPISMEPAHFVTILSSLTSNSSLGFNGLEVNTTPLLKSSIALRNKFPYAIKEYMIFGLFIEHKQINLGLYLGLCAVRPLLITSACVPQQEWNISLSGGSSSPVSMKKFKY